MATYAIGDIQGCFLPFQKLLEKIQFNPQQDTLWLAGDVVNRGPHSLETLRFIKTLGHAAKMVLGNHDLHLLALYYGASTPKHSDTLQAILQAPDRDELLLWLKQQPLLHHDAKINFTMVHAGVAAEWDLSKAMQLALEVESVLQSEKATEFFQHMYGNSPSVWDEDLKGYERLRCIVNYFTRVRFCHPDGGMDLKTKGSLELETATLIPWFKLPQRKTQNNKIIFGHWAALKGVANTPNIYPLDTGCIWGNCLTAMCLETEERFRVSCSE